MMKFSHILMLALVAVLFSACGGSNNSANSDVTNTTPTQQPSVLPPGSAGAAIVQHYICPNNCEGSGGEVAGSCPVCGSEYQHNQAYHDQQQPQPQAQPEVTTTPANAAVAGGVMHYICPNSCEGSGGDAAGTCPVCGSEYLHNDAYHNQGDGTTTTTVNPSISNMRGPQAQPNGQTPNVQTTTPTMPQAPAPAQNAAGVYHYACTKSGCGGGAGSAGNCPKCGSALAHNQAYHQ